MEYFVGLECLTVSCVIPDAEGRIGVAVTISEEAATATVLALLRAGLSVAPILEQIGAERIAEYFNGEDW